jgi:hypothetical protein
MTPGDITRGIRDFVGRDWNAARVNKQAYWADRIARLGPMEAFRIADELRRQVIERGTGWPGPDDRDADLQAHIRLTALLRRAGTTRRR